MDQPEETTESPDGVPTYAPVYETEPTKVEEFCPSHKLPPLPRKW